jgi:hypothetical protein
LKGILKNYLVHEMSIHFKNLLLNKNMKAPTFKNILEKRKNAYVFSIDGFDDSYFWSDNAIISKNDSNLTDHVEKEKLDKMEPDNIYLLETVKGGKIDVGEKIGGNRSEYIHAMTKKHFNKDVSKFKKVHLPEKAMISGIGDIIVYHLFDANKELVGVDKDYFDYINQRIGYDEMRFDENFIYFLKDKEMNSILGKIITKGSPINIT